MALIISTVKNGSDGKQLFDSIAEPSSRAS